MLAAWGFVHDIDPVISRLFGVPLYWYGFAYALGFLGVYGWFRWKRVQLGWLPQEPLEMAVCFAASVLVCGRAFAIAVYQWDYYGQHLDQLLSWWRGGMASHGVLLGGLAGSWVFCRLRRKSLLLALDEVVLPGALFLALGRIGNFINGTIIGTATALPWGVEFPPVEGYRHPVTLYESAKNLAIIPILLWVRRRWRPGRGVLLAHFVFWYGFLRIFTDLFREHGRTFLGIGRNQYFNALMAVVGVGLWLWFCTRGRPGEGPLSESDTSARTVESVSAGRRWLMRGVFAGLICLSLTIPGAWTRGTLERLGRLAPPRAARGWPYVAPGEPGRPA